MVIRESARGDRIKHQPEPTQRRHQVSQRQERPQPPFLPAPSVPAGVQQHQYHTYHGADDGKTESESLHKTKAHHAVPPSSLGSRFPAAASRSATTARE